MILNIGGIGMYNQPYIKENIKIPNWGVNDQSKRFLYMMAGVVVHNQQRFGLRYYELEFPIPELLLSEFKCNLIIIKIENSILKFEKW
jgi:hypothetical protein